MCNWHTLDLPHASLPSGEPAYRTGYGCLIDCVGFVADLKILVQLYRKFDQMQWQSFCLPKLVYRLPCGVHSMVRFYFLCISLA